MTGEIANRLYKYNSKIISAIKSNYTLFSADEFKDFCEIYKEHYGMGLSTSERNCSTCKLRAVKRIGADYEKYKAWWLRRYGVEFPNMPQQDSNLADSNTNN